MNKFNTLYRQIISEMTTDIGSEQIVIDAIEDEILGNDIKLKEDWKQHVSPIVTYVEENLPKDKTIYTIDYR